MSKTPNWRTSPVSGLGDDLVDGYDNDEEAVRKRFSVKGKPWWKGDVRGRKATKRKKILTALSTASF